LRPAPMNGGTSAKPSGLLRSTPGIITEPA